MTSGACWGLRRRLGWCSGSDPSLLFLSDSAMFAAGDVEALLPKSLVRRLELVTESLDISHILTAAARDCGKGATAYPDCEIADGTMTPNETELIAAYRVWVDCCSLDP